MIHQWYNKILSIGTHKVHDPAIESKIKMTNSWYLFFILAIVIFISLHLIINRPLPPAPFIAFFIILSLYFFNYLGLYKTSWHLFSMFPVCLLIVSKNNFVPPTALGWYLVMLAIAFNLFKDKSIQLFYLVLTIISTITLAIFLFTDIIRPNNYSDNIPLNVFHLVGILLLQGSLLYTLHSLEEKHKNILRANDNMFKQLFEYNPLGIVIVRTDFSEKEINQRIVEMLGYSKEEFYTKKISSYTHPEDSDNHSPYFQEMMAGKRAYAEFVNRHLAKNGQYFHHKIFVSSIFNTKGERTHNFAIYEDIDKKLEQKKQIQSLIQELKTLNTGLEQKVFERAKILEKANEDLIRSNQDLEQFAYIASHDLQEPLRMIGNFVQLLKRRYNDKIDEEGQQYIDFAVEGVQRMSDLIRALLEYSRVGRKEGKMRPTNIKRVVESKRYELRATITDKEAIINVQDLPKTMVCEAQQMGIIFFHLIENGLKFNKNDTPIIDISCEELDSHFHFTIEDNGIGIETQYHEQAFEIFKRLHSRDEYEGNGIGLALSKKIVQRHGGTIWIENNEKRGTSIHFTIDKSLTA